MLLNISVITSLLMDPFLEGVLGKMMMVDRRGWILKDLLLCT